MTKGEKEEETQDNIQKDDVKKEEAIEKLDEEDME